MYLAWHINTTHYIIIIRSDLPLGFMAAQIVHAAGASITQELPPNTNAVVLDAKSEHELRTIAKALAKAGIAHVVIIEPDAPWNGAPTAIGVHPVTDRTKVKKVLSSLPLLGKQITPEVSKDAST